MKMIDKKKNKDFELEEFFQAAKEISPAPSDVLRDKILESSKHEFKKLEAYSIRQNQNLWWKNLYSKFGNFYLITGYGAIASICIFIGFSYPDLSSVILPMDKQINEAEIIFADPIIDLSILNLEE